MTTKMRAECLSTEKGFDTFLSFRAKIRVLCDIFFITQKLIKEDNKTQYGV